LDANREMPDTSAGIILYKLTNGELRVLLAHPGGPFWRNRDEGAWTIPKGVKQGGEQSEAAARREFAEELGAEARGEMRPLGEIRQRGGKRVVAFALEGDFDPAGLRSNEFVVEWPPKSGRTASFPEIDRAAWFPLAVARTKILPAQAPLLDRLETMLSVRGDPS
jgi:predicted NUDIX family NTP pyrophosphohydrolase